jgi:hypothetical protein
MEGSAMLYNLNHSHVSLSDWQKFGREFSPLVGEVIDREATKLPDWFVPFALGVSLLATLCFAQRAIVMDCAGRADGARRSVMT